MHIIENGQGEKNMSNKIKSHIRYKNKDGKLVPGVTTALNILNKPALVKWANNLGLQGIDSNKYRDKMGDIGTLAHYLILCYFKQEKPDTSEYSKDDIDKAENCMLSFYEWEKTHPLEPILVEEPLVSENHQYGGTIDLLTKINGDLTLVDFKTGKAIYPEMLYQVAAYEQLLVEHGYTINKRKILRIGRDESEGFEDKELPKLSVQWQIFLNCLNIYNLKKKEV